MNVATTHAVKSPVTAIVPPVQRKVEPSVDHDEAPRRLLTSLSAVPTVQRACAGCGGEDDENITSVMPKLEVGPVDDPYEREADDIAGRVMAMRSPAAVQPISEDVDGEVMARRVSVRRKCASCGSDDTPVMPRLEVGPVDDPYEREADDIAGRVMAMRSPSGVLGDTEEGDGIDSTAPVARRPILQRKCATCANKDDQMPVQPLRAMATVQRAPAPLSESDALRDLTDMPRMKANVGAGTEHISASAGQLSAGGSALSPDTRNFFESRMGRDLSQVRIHKGEASNELNTSISSRAFTFRNHIWLGGGEPEGPTFTMAHEMAHVLQQTQPGAVGQEAMARRSGESKVRRAIAEEDQKYAPDGRLGSHHDEAVKKATGNSGTIFSELRVPNANRTGLTKISSGASSPTTKGKGFGFADLVKPTTTGSNLWGLGFVGTNVSSVPHPWYVVNDSQLGYLRPSSLGYPDTRPAAFNGKDVSGNSMHRGYWNKSMPRFHTTDFLKDSTGKARDAAKAPTAYSIGEMKFVGIEGRETMASTQVKHYISGFNLARNAYNTMADQAAAVKAGSNALTGKPKFNLTKATLTSSKMASGVGPSDFAPVGTKSLMIYPALAGGSGDDEKAEKQDDKGKKGALYYRQNPNGYLWEYAFLPLGQLDLFGPNSYKKKIEIATKDGAKLHTELTATPSGSKVRGRRVRPIHAMQPKRANDTQQRTELVRRRGKKLPPKKDPFVESYTGWTRRQKAFTKSFKGYIKPKAGKAPIEVSNLRHDIALINTMEAMGKAPKGRTFPSVSAGDKTKLKSSRKRLNNADLVAGSSGRILGVLRKLFGGAYIKITNLYRGVRTKLETFWKKRKKKFGGGKSLGTAIMKVGGKIIFQILKLLLPEVARMLQNCVEQGFNKVMNDAIANVKKATFAGQVDKAIADLETKATEIQTQIEAKAQSIVDGITKDYEGVLTVLKTAGTLLRIAKGALNAARIATCVLGGIETFGGACLAALADFLLGLIGYSPIERTASWALSTCLAQDYITGKLLALKEIKALPAKVTQIVIDQVRPPLKSFQITPPAPLAPFTLADLLCKTVGAKADMPKASDFSCGSAKRPDGDGGGKSNGGKSSGGKSNGGKSGGGKNEGGKSGGGKNEGGKSDDAGGQKKNEGGASKTKGDGKSGSGDGGAANGNEDMIIVRDPETVGAITGDKKDWEGVLLIVSGFNLDNPPAKNSRVDVRVRIRYTGVQITMTQQIVFLEVHSLQGRRYVRFYLPRQIVGESKAKVGPYDLGDGNRFNLNRGSSAKVDAPVKGQK